MATDTFSQEANASGDGVVVLNPGTVKKLNEPGDYIAFAFDNVDIAQGATISDATLTVEVDAAVADGEAILNCDDVDDAAGLDAWPILIPINASGSHAGPVSALVVAVAGADT